MKYAMKIHTPFSRFTRFSILVLFACGFVWLTGCTTPGSSIEVKQAPVVSLARYKIVAVDVVSRDADFSPGYVVLLSNALVDDLRKSGRFDKVYDSSFTSERDADLKLSVLVELVLVYNVKSIESSVTLTDIANGKTLAKAVVDAHSESAFLGGQMTNAITKLNEQVVTFAIQH
ncbi:MAG TPA: hypothetical protein VMO20_00940 [Candidatus Acidoferrum sp.]|nr:hypothetical protein [Candidatus Acidoferrum sp.]